jgi:hypothetical protein
VIVWGNRQSGDCVHGESATECRACHPSQQELIDSPWALVLGLLLIVAALMLGPAAIDRELANDEAQARRHRANVERHAPSAIAAADAR